MADTRVITAHVPAEMAEQVDKYAEQMDRSRGWIVKQALADWLSWEEEKNRLTRQAIEDGGLRSRHDLPELPGLPTLTAMPMFVEELPDLLLRLPLRSHPRSNRLALLLRPRHQPCLLA